MKVLFVSNDHVGSKMAGPGIRSMRLATELASEHDVTLLVPFSTDIHDERITIVADDPWDAQRMRRRVAGYEVVVAQKLPVPTMRALARSSITAIYDLYAPVTIEALALGSRDGRSRLPVTHRLNAVTQELVLACGDAFICASERQRDLWLGALLGIGRIDQALYDGEPSLRTFIDVVPFGIDPAPPSHERQVLRGVIPGIGESDHVLLWGGGIWNWFDPLTVIHAVAQIARDRDDLRLVFLGLRHPNPGVPQMEMERRAVSLAEELGVRDRVVFFNQGWVPYAERGAYYLEADVGVSAHFDDLETRFAFRTRLLDCFWAGLPVVTTAGDALGELVRARKLGTVVEPEHIEGWTAALGALIANEGERTAIRARLEAVRAELVWPEAVKPLRRLVSAAPRRADHVERTTQLRYLRARVENAVSTHGIPGAAEAAFRRAVGRPVPAKDRIPPPLR
jgi:glycosyltransferase involved in cell wall biosynthesis